MSERVAAATSHEEIVNASFDALYNQLQAKVYHPEHNVPNVISSQILHDNGPAGVERRMHNTQKGDIHELITWTNESNQVDGHTLRRSLFTFNMLSDPQLEGFVTNEAWETLDDGKVVLHLKYTMHWLYQESLPVEQRVSPFPNGPAPVMKGAVMMMKNKVVALNGSS
jgi:hypothetical protein